MSRSPTDGPIEVFDRRLVRLRRDRAAATVARVAPLLEAAADRLLDRLEDTTRVFTRALEIGGRGVVAPLLRARGIPFVVSMDLSARMAAGAGGVALAGDEEVLPFAAESLSAAVEAAVAAVASALSNANLILVAEPFSTLRM